MALNSFNFLVCFAFLFALLLVLEAVKTLTKSKILSRIQIVTLIIFSYSLVFLADWRFFVCILSATALTYLLALGIEKAKTAKTQKVYLSTGICVLVLMLGYFKYTNFFISGFSSLFNVQASTLDIILPIGISFYTFSAIAYLIDIYRKKYEAVTNVLDFALYIVFFPKLSSGPIVRGKTFFPQVKNYRGIKAKNVCDGLQIFVFGLFKKIVLADHLGVFVNNVYSSPQSYSTATVILAVLSYSLQIYFDFSGYSDMAIGLSKMVGFDFESNFNLPYIATSFSDFWKRWHISLSSWFMEYLYIPLGGSRKGGLRTCVNLLIVMLISGLWHGAGITFILWGLLYGVLSCVEHLLKKKNVVKKQRPVLNSVKALGIFIAVTLLWIPFRATSLSNMLNVLKGCFTLQQGIWHPYSWTFFALFCLIISTVFAVVKSKKSGTKDKNGLPYVNGYYPLMNLTKFGSLCIFFIFCGLTLILGYFGNTAFIYGAF